MNAGARDGYLFLSLLQAKAGASIVSHLGDADPAAIPQMGAREFAQRFSPTEKVVAAFEELRRAFDAEETRGRLAE